MRLPSRRRWSSALGLASTIALTSGFTACGTDEPTEAATDATAAAVSSAPSKVVPLTSPLDLETASWRLVSSAHIYDGQTANALDDGTLLLVGGRVYDGTATTGATVRFNPSTNVWQTLPSMHQSRALHLSAKLLDGRVLVASGEHIEGQSYDSLLSAEVFDPGTSTWTQVPDMLWYQFNPSVTTLPDGKVLLLGGFFDGAIDSAQVFDPSAGTNGAWNEGEPLPRPVENHTATLLPDGSLFVAGGRDTFVENGVYVLASGEWNERPFLLNDRSHHTATVLNDGRVLVVGGLDAEYLPSSSVEIHDPSGTESPVETASLEHGRMNHRAALLPDGRVIVVGGEDDTGSLSSTEIFDPATETWSQGPELNEARHAPSLLLVGGHLVVVGGWSSGEGPLSSLEILDIGAPLGTSCSDDTECTSGFCIDGVCCDTGCEGACVACTAALKQGGEDGVCGPVAAGTNPRFLCTDEGAASCGTTGVCDAAGSCAVYDDGTECGNGMVCASGQCTSTSSGCEDQPDGAVCGADDECSIGLCRDGSCVVTHKVDGTRCEGGVCIAGQCKLDPVPHASGPDAGPGGGGGADGDGDGSGAGSPRDGSASSDDDEGGGGFCSLSPAPSETSPMVMALAWLAGLGLVRRARKSRNAA